VEDGAWKKTGGSSVDSVYRRRLEPGKELEDQLWIREGCTLERNWKISCG
jgi:hypothetical protein